MKDFLESVVKNIVEQPDQVVISEDSAEGRITLTIKVADEDMGRIIGKDGKVINSIRMIMRVMAIRQNVRIRIDLEDNKSQTPREDSTPVQEQPQMAVEPETTATDVVVPTAADFVGQNPTESSTTVLDNSKKS